LKDNGYYGPGSATWKIASEAAITLGGARAVLLQIAHPLVAAGVFAAQQLYDRSLWPG